MTWPTFWQFLTFLPIFENFENFWQFWQLSTLLTMLTIFDNVWQFLTISDNFWQFLTIFDHFWPFLTIFDNFWQFGQFLKIWTICKDCWQFWQFLTNWNFLTILTIIDNFWQFWHFLTILETCDIWDTDYNSDNSEPEFMTFFVTWQLRVTLDSICNSCDVLSLNTVHMLGLLSILSLFLSSPGHWTVCVLRQRTFQHIFIIKYRVLTPVYINTFFLELFVSLSLSLYLLSPYDGKYHRIFYNILYEGPGMILGWFIRLFRCSRWTDRWMCSKRSLQP